jgi:hypothetical protein
MDYSNERAENRKMKKSKQIISRKMKKTKQITSIERVLVAQWKFLIGAFYTPEE